MQPDHLLPIDIFTPRSTHQKRLRKCPKVVRASERPQHLVFPTRQRQLRRYLQRACGRLADATQQNLKSLMGRHLMQRRGLYARALKTNDVRTALLVLKDEALLEGLYPATKIAASANEELYPHNYESGPPLSREERFERLLAATDREDQVELRLLEQVTPIRTLRIPDTMLPKLMLDMCALMYVGEQLDHASMVFLASIESARDPSREAWSLIADVHGYRFKIGMAGWQLFTDSLGVDGIKLVKANHFGSALELCSDILY